MITINLEERNKMKILNLYAGLGGNRKLWGSNHDITAVENNEDIAIAYHKLFPNDEVIITDAHEFLISNYKNFDFIWSSPPCPTHSDMRRCAVHAGRYDAVYPSMDLYQEIILLRHFAKGHWIVENVKPYYDYLIQPDFVINRHPFWSSLSIKSCTISDDRRHNEIKGYDVVYGFDLSKEKIKGYKGGKRAILRNLVNPEIGKFILEEAIKNENTYR